ncbi:MAG: sensor histidine kinase [Planctomycetaceae bacterium]
MPFERHPIREVFGTLRFRLTAWNTAVVLAMITFTLWGVREGLRLILWHEADTQLVEDAKEARATYEQLYPATRAIEEEFDRRARTHTHRGLHIRIFDDRNNVVWTSVNAPEPPFPARYFESGRKPTTAGLYRLVHEKTSAPGVPPVTIRVGASVEPLEQDVVQITRLMLAVGAISLFVSPLGGYWLAGRATRPIAQIIDTTKRLHPTRMVERLPLRGTGDELDRLSATINGFLDRIASYLEQNREFTANAAHELRSPLAAIQSSLEVALSSDRTPEEYKERLTDVLDECQSLRRLINQLLLLAESDAGNLAADGEAAAFDLIVARACDMFLGVAEAAGVQLNLERLDPAYVSGDVGRLRQVVNNLLDNAIKYTRRGGRVHVQLTAVATDRTARLAVRDTGVGISREDLPHVFNRFFRGDKARARERFGRGTGLGLAICQSIVEAYGGRITLESQLDQGTTVTVILPLVDANTSKITRAMPAEQIESQAPATVTSRGA